MSEREPGVTAANIRDAVAWKGWTMKQAAEAFGVGVATLHNWKSGFAVPRGQARERVRALILEMAAARTAVPS